MVVMGNDNFSLIVTPMPESWIVQWRHWLDDLDAGKISTEEIRKQLFQMRDKK